MKKFLMVTPQQQPGQLAVQTYAPQGNTLLEYGETRFPVIPLINGYAEAGETVAVVAVTYDLPSCKHNLSLLEEELAGLSETRSISCNLESISVPADDSVSAVLHVFQELIDRTADDDVLHACITFGSKPMPIVMVMALQYAYRIKRNVSIDCVVYGAIDFNADPRVAKIYDVTSLVKLDEIVRLLAERGVENPESIFRTIL